MPLVVPNLRYVNDYNSATRKILALLISERRQAVILFTQKFNFIADDKEYTGDVLLYVYSRVRVYERIFMNVYMRVLKELKLAQIDDNSVLIHE